MTWLAWRQFRKQAWAAAGLLAVVALCYGLSGYALRGLATDMGYPGCIEVDNCRELTSSVRASTLYSGLYWAGTILVYLAPALIGMFWGAPLVARELSSGGYRVLWTQSISRTRWLGTKIAVVGSASLVTATLLSLVVTWWSVPLDAVGGPIGGMHRLSPVVFGARGLVPIGVAAFAFALGATLGLMVRRTLPAMAITVLLLLALQIAAPLAVRPHLAAPVTAAVAIDRPAGIEVFESERMRIEGDAAPIGAWILTDITVGPDGQEFTGRAPESCLQFSMDACADDIAALHLTQQISYQPADRYWPFQLAETGIFLALAAILSAFSAWRINRLA